MRLPIIKMLTNRVRRNYSGGASLDTFQGITNPIDSNKPEEWLCSTVEANNPGMSPIPNEGLSVFEYQHSQHYLRDILVTDSLYYLNTNYFEGLSFLAKWLDSSIRLHTQAHPTRAFSRKYLGTNHGKFEAYYVMSIRETVTEPYIRLGFQRKGISKDVWAGIIESQDIEAMDSCFEKIPVAKGDVIYIPGGMPHAIGEGIMLLEVMEPSDLVVRCEFTRNGLVVPNEARFMGRDLEFCLNIFDYTYRSVDTVLSTFFLKPEPLAESSHYVIERLMKADISGCFELIRIKISGLLNYTLDHRYAVLTCTSGSGHLECEGYSIEAEPLDCFFIAASTQSISITATTHDLEVCLILPP